MAKIDIIVDTKGAYKVKNLDKDLRKIDKSADSTSKSMGVLSARLVSAAAALYAVQAATTAIISTGFQYNRMMENQINGLQSLIVATSNNVSSTGELLTTTEMYTLAAEEATEQMKRLQDINAATPHTLGQTAQIFKALFTSSKAAGASMEDMTKITKLVSIAAGGAGIEFQQVLASVDGLANGTFLANSEMGRFLTSLGLTNTELKELAKTGDSIPFIIKKLKTFDRQVDTMDVTVSNLTNAWDQLTGHITKNIFEETKPALNALSQWLADITNDMKEAEIAAKSIYAVKGENETAIKAAELAKELQEINDKLKEGLGLWDVMFSADAHTVEQLEQRRKYLEKQLERLGKKFVQAAGAPKKGGLTPSVAGAPVESMTGKKQDIIDEELEFLQWEIDLRNEKLEAMAEYYGVQTQMHVGFLDSMTSDEQKAFEARNKWAAKSSKEQTKDVLGNMIAMTSGMARENKSMFEINKMASLANAAIKTPEAIMNSYAFGTQAGGPVLGAIMAGIASAAQLTQMASIASASYGGGGSTSTPTAGGGFSTTPGTVPSDIGTTPEAAKEVSISLGDKAYVSTEAVRELLDDIQAELDDGYKLRVS